MGDREGAGQPIGAEREAEVGWEEPRERQKEKEKERKGERRGGGGHTQRATGSWTERKGRNQRLRG